MELRELGPDDPAAVAAFVDVDNARHVDAPWMAPATTYRRENAASNDQMVGINERLGYRVTGRILEFQRRI